MNDNRNHLIAPIMIFIGGIIPAICTGIPGLMILLFVCVYFYDRDKPRPDPIIQKIQVEAQEKVQTTDYNQELLNKYFDFETGITKPAIKEWAGDRRFPFINVYIDKDNIFHMKNTDLISCDPAVTSNNLRNRSKVLRAEEGKLSNARMEKYYEIQQAIIDQKINIWSMPEFILKKCFAHDDAPARLSMVRYSWQDNDMKRRAIKNSIILFAFGLSDGKVLDSISEDTKHKMLEDSEKTDCYCFDSKKAIRFDRDKYKTFLTSWEEHTLPPIYSSKLDGAALAYLDYECGFLKVLPDHSLAVSPHIKGLLPNDVRKSGDVKQYQYFYCLPKYKLMED